MSEFTRELSPAFAAFKAFAADAIARQPNLTRLDCLNPIKAIRHDFDLSLVPEIDLERAWGRYLGIRFQRSFTSVGVRDSLLTLFRGPLKSRVVSLPADIYPVYQMLANTAGIRFVTYPTLPRFNLEAALKTDTVLLTAPLTPLGRDFQEAEVSALARWLRADPTRLIVVDRVYDYANSTALQPLIDTNQAMVCHSLSKTHLSPLVSGFTVVPDHFDIASSGGSNPDAARVLLTRYRDFPRTQQSIFRHRWEQLAPPIRALDESWQQPETGYLSVVAADHGTLLAQGVLAVPGAVYGTSSDTSIITCLHETNDRADRDVVDRYHVTVLSNFARGHDRYSRTYSKANVPQSTFPDRFFLLPADQLDIGFAKARRLLQKTAAGDRAVVIHTRVERHELRPNTGTGLGEYVERNHVELVRLLDADLAEIRVVDAYADSLVLNGDLLDWVDVKPRSLSVLPIARACQAKCDFCFSHSSVSDEQQQGRIVLAELETACVESRQRGAERLVITGGGEPTLLAHNKLLDIMRIGSRHFRKIVLITNGYNLGHAEPAERLRFLRDYQAAGLSVLAVSRHSHDRNAEIMHLDTRSELMAKTWREHRPELADMTLRWICVLQKHGVADERGLRAYLDWVVEKGGDEVCFKELYVAAMSESVYRESAYNAWCEQHQIPLSLVTEFLNANDATKLGQLPWGAPFYRLKWRGRELTVAAYTEPSVFWERKTGICRSWNLMADGTCYANLETTGSRLTLGGSNLLPLAASSNSPIGEPA